MSFSRGEWPASWRQVPRHAHSFIPRLMDQFRRQNAGQSASRSAAEVAAGPVGLRGGLQPPAASAVRGFQSPRGTARAKAPRHGDYEKKQRTDTASAANAPAQTQDHRTGQWPRLGQAIGHREVPPPPQVLLLCLRQTKLCLRAWRRPSPLRLIQQYGKRCLRLHRRSRTSCCRPGRLVRSLRANARNFKKRCEGSAPNKECLARWRPQLPNDIGRQALV